MVSIEAIDAAAKHTSFKLRACHFHTATGWKLQGLSLAMAVSHSSPISIIVFS
jgi:hypothetical protein